MARNEEMKRVMQEAIDGWLDKKFTEFGKWSFRGMLALAAAVTLYMTLTANGWHKP